MADLQIPDELSEALHQIAASDNQSVEALLTKWLQRYQMEKNNELLADATGNESWRGKALDAFVGMFDDMITSD